MTNSKKTDAFGSLPDFLQVTVEKGIVDERTAKRIELYRRTRGLGQNGALYALVNTAPDPNLTFSNFVQCKGNAFAFELAKTVASKSPSKLPYNPLYLYGDVGLGKTHLLSAIANEAAGRNVLLVNTADLDAEFEKARRLNARAELRQWLVSAEIILIDDIQICEGHEDLQRELFSILNHMTRASRWVIISSDVPPTRLAGMETRLLSRLGGGVIVSLQMGDKAERMDLLRHFLDERALPNDVLDYLAQNITDNVRRLKAAVAQLLTVSEVIDSAVTIDMARAVAPLPEEQSMFSVRPTDGSDPANYVEPQVAGETQSMAERFKEMLAIAESEEEQALALQIALGERIRQLRHDGGDNQTLMRLEKALEMLREGNMEEAIRCITI